MIPNKNKNRFLMVLFLIQAFGVLTTVATTASCDASQSNYGCSAFGRCQTAQGVCQCNAGFTGDGLSCSSSCISNGTNLCSTTTSAACIDFGNDDQSYGCACKEGYFYNTAAKRCQDLDECTRRWCSSYSQCINEEGDYQCKCCYSNEGWQGISGFGYFGDGKTKCYPDSILVYGDSDNSSFLNTSGSSHHVTVPGGFPFFGQLHWDIYVHVNGLITFDSPDAPYFGGSDFPSFRQLKFVAPFWTQLQPAPNVEGAGLYVDVFNAFRNAPSNKAPLLMTSEKTLYSLLDDLGWPGFVPRQILTATWKSMVPVMMDASAGNLKARITFQSVLVSNGSHSFGFNSFAEDPADTDWNVPLDGVFIGFSGEDFASRQPVSDISELFQNPPNVDSVCSSMTFLTQRGRFYKVFGPPFAEEENNAACLDAATKQWRQYGNFGVDDNTEDEDDSALPPDLYCPCLEQQAFSDNRFVLANIEPFSENRHSCHMSRFFKSVSTSAKQYRARAYCCYDNQGALITEGVNAGGVVPEGLEQDMLQLKGACCANSPLCEVFHRIYKPIGCRRYDRPRVAYIRGATHFNSFANTDYTFNGRGEFTYFSIRNPRVNVQVRLVNKTYETGETTSFLTAMAIQCLVPNDTADSDPSVRIAGKAEIRVVAAENDRLSSKLELLIDGAKVSLPYQPFEFSTMFYVSCDDGDFCEVACKYSNNIFSFQARLVNDYLRINTTAPAASEVPTLAPSGLAGTFEGRLVYTKDGSVIEVSDSSNDKEVYTFGEAMRTSAVSSLFTYEDGTSWETYNDASDSYKPSFWTDLRPTITIDTLESVCHCESDQACQYDQLVTGDKAVSLSTHQALQIIATDRNAFATFTPQWRAPSYILLSIHENFHLNLSTFVMYDENGKPADEGRAAIEPDYFQLFTNLGPQYYMLDDKTGDLAIVTTSSPRLWRYNTFNMAFYAAKQGQGSIVASSRYTPEIFVCACDQQEQCDESYMSRSFLERESNEDSYYLLPCRCPADSNNRFCDGRTNPCYNNPCSPDAYCQLDAQSASGYVCTCQEGFSGNGFICKLNDCPSSNECSQRCELDSESAEAKCDCEPGYMLLDDGKTCREINECDYPGTCSENEICKNVDGSYYCQCQAGFKPEKNTLRSGCIKTAYTYVGSIEFVSYWDTLTKSWQSWNDNLADNSHPSHLQTARQLEAVIELLLQLVDPVGTDLYTFVNKFTKGTGDRTVVHYKFYPGQSIAASLTQSALQEYITRLPDGSVFKGVVASSISIMESAVGDQCGSYGCGSPFASCKTGDEGKECRCNPGFVLSPRQFIPNVTACESFCFARDCERTSSHSCRDFAYYGAQCLCKKGYRLNERLNICEKVSYCSNEFGVNPCGPNADCIEDIATFKCSCHAGFVPSNKPSPVHFCVAESLYCDIPAEEAAWPEGVVVTTHGAYKKLLIPVGFPFGGTKQWKIYIGLNGFVSFDKMATSSELASFFPATYGNYIAPLWTDFVTADAADKTKIRVYDSTQSQMTLYWHGVVEQLRQDIQVAEMGDYPYYNVLAYPSIANPLNFNPKTIVVVTWQNVQLRPFIERDHATFQVVIASDGTATVVVANYDSLAASVESWNDMTVEANRSLAYPHRGFVGFQVANRRLCLSRRGFVEADEGVDCRDFLFDQLTTSMSESLPGGRHIFLVANDNKVTTSPDRKCYDTLSYWTKDMSETFTEYSSVLAAVADTKPSPTPCPWTETQAQLDQRFNKLIGPMGKSCYVQRFNTEFSYEYPANSGKQKNVNMRPYCCYRNGALLTQSSSNTRLIINEFQEMQTRILADCCTSSAHCPVASYFVPPYYLTDYRPPITVAVFGDPHFATINHASITFKGRGDFVLYDHPKLKIHGRFNELSRSVNGSVLMAVTWKADGYQLANVSLDSSSGVLSMKLDGVEVDLSQTAFRGPFDTVNGEMLSKLNGSDVVGVSMTYVDGLSFEITAIKGLNAGPYLQLRARLPPNFYVQPSANPRGLLANFIYPNGDLYAPVYFRPSVVDDKHYFMNFAKNWTVSSANLAQMFGDSFDNGDYIPPFFSDWTSEAQLQTFNDALTTCQDTIPCAYDLVVTGDQQLAMITLSEQSAVQKLRREAAEVPPTFNMTDPVWLIYVNGPFSEYLPHVFDLTPDVVFSMDTDFPRHLYVIEPATGRFVITMTAEARDTLLNKGPFYFYIVARRGSTGASTFKPVTVRICNCADERSCDLSDDRDAVNVGVIPTENVHGYSIARCNCLSNQTGFFCDETYKACETSPCYPGTACLPRSTSPAFVCLDCPDGMVGDGFHCVEEDPCKGVECSSPKTCQVVSEVGVCLCPANAIPTSDGSCEYINRCSRECTKMGMNCNYVGEGKHWCECQPGYAPIYKVTYPPELESCQPISYTYHGQVSFEWYYSHEQDLVRFSAELSQQHTDAGKTFARNMTADLKNAINLLKYNSIVSVSVVNVSPLPPDNGFIVDFFAFTNTKLIASEIQHGLALYYEQTLKVGTLVQILEPRRHSFFVEICSSPTLNPCKDIIEISTCRELGIKGQSAVCQCNVTLQYSPYPSYTEDGQLQCQDNCDRLCKNKDLHSECWRPQGPASRPECVCSFGYGLSNVNLQCEEKPPVCTPDSCGSNAECVPLDDENHKCVCRPGFTENLLGQCVSYCEMASYCNGVANAFGCTNLDTAYRCSCKGGFAWDDSNRACVDVDECVVGTHTCSKLAQCTNSLGSYSCRCGDEYLSESGGAICYGDTLYPFDFSANKNFIRDGDSVWNTTFLGGFYYNKTVFNDIFVGFDGFISFDYIPPYKYFGKTLSTHMLAAFFMDLDFNAVDSSAGLYVDVFDKASMVADDKWQQVFEKVTENLQRQFPDAVIASDSVPDMMLIATWKNISPAPSSAYSQYKTTFQAVLSLTSGFSFAILNFAEAPSTTNWPTLPSLQPLVGYTIGQRDASLKILNGNPHSFQGIFSDTKQIRGRHLVAFGENVDLQSRKCLTEYQQFPANVSDIINELGNSHQLARHSSCPGFQAQVELDPRWQPEIDLPQAAVLCYGGSFSTKANVSISREVYSVRSFCCYDKDTGAWLDNNPSTRHVGSFFQVEEFRHIQEALFDSCCRKSPFCELFGLKHPAKALSPENYTPPVIGYVIGDPHLGIVEHVEDYPGREIRFNGIGDYVLVKSKEHLDQRISAIDIQIRFSRNDQVTTRATFVTGVAIKVGLSDTIEVITHGAQLKVFRNGTKLDLNSLNLTVPHNLVDEHSYDLWAKSNFVGFAAHSGVSLAIYEIDDSYFNVRVSIPDFLTNHFDNRVCGLLTSFDEEPYSDCSGDPPEGDVWGDEIAAYHFGQRFKLASVDQSLFSYREGPSFDEVNTMNPSWMPVFSSELVGKYPADVNSVCSATTATASNACKFDYGVTFNRSIAQETLRAAVDFQAAQSFATALRPSITNTDGKLTIRNVISQTVFEVDVSCSLEPHPLNFFYRVETNIPSSFYTFNDESGIFSMPISSSLLRDIRRRQDAPYLRFWAIFGPASDIWTPTTFTCACDQIAQCDFSYESLFYLERAANIKHNYFLPCNCPPTRRGAFCEIAFNPCDENPCSTGVQCNQDESSLTGFTCGTCPAGFVTGQDGTCKPKICPEGMCTNGDCYVSSADGSFMCKCWPGYEHSSTNSHFCQDINECQLGTHDCYRLGKGMQCNNNPGSFSCSCRTGYSPDNSLDVQACNLEKNQISGKVKATSVLVDNVVISWSPALAIVGSPLFLSVASQMEKDLLNWYKIDLKQINVKSIYVRKLMEGSIVADYLAFFDGTVNTTEVEVVQKNYFSTATSIGSLEGVDPSSVTVSSDPCDQDTTCDLTSTECVWNSDSVATRCQCLLGFVAIPESATTCLDNCTSICVARHGPNVKCTRDPIQPNSFACECLPNFSLGGVGSLCVDSCDSSPCFNGGVCGTSSSGHVCKCPETHVGANCQLACNCQNGAACYEQGSVALCRCPPGFTGANCESMDTACTINPCQNNGTCGVTTTGWICECPNEYYGRTCSKRCECQNGGICDPKTEDGLCLCPIDFSGSKCEASSADHVDDHALMIVSAVLGALIFVLLCVTSFAVIERQKALAKIKKDGKEDKTGSGGNYEMANVPPSAYQQQPAQPPVVFMPPPPPAPPAQIIFTPQPVFAVSTNPAEPSVDEEYF